jgi:PAS domain S-box-containing protein
MNTQSLPYLIPYLASAAISTGVGIYAWRRRAVTGAAPFALWALAQASYTLGYVFELASPNLEAKILWDNSQFVGMFVAPIALFAFALQYTGRKLAHPKRTWGLLAIVPTISLLLVLTDDLHGLIRPAAWLVPGEPFSALVYDFTTVFWAMTIYVYGLVLSAVAILIRKLIYPQRLYRAQIGAILIGTLIPVVGGLFSVTGKTSTFHRDIAPLTFAFNNLIVAWGLFRYRLFDIGPVARDAVIESMSDVVLVVDVQGRVVDLNPAALEVIGRPASEVIGQPVVHVFSDWPDLVEQFPDAEEAHIEIAVGTEEGPRHFDLRLSSLRDRRGRLTGRLAVARDITERKRAEEEIEKRTMQLEAANERLQILSRAKDEFVSNVSHELRTPISSFKLYLGLLTRRPEKQDAYLATLQRETGRLENMIEALLTLSRLDQNHVSFDLAPIDLNALSEEYVTDRASLAESKGLALEFDVEPDLPTVGADQDLIGQVLSILLTNALNYTPAGGRVIVSTRARQFENRLWVGFSVSDAGPGISAEEQGQLFTRFFRGKAGRESKVPGTGLGLAIVKEIVGRHQGRVELESEGVSGKGATFSVWLPAQES